MGARTREPLLIAVAQPLSVPREMEMNALVHAATVRSAGARVVVFPELSLTGYELDAEPVTADDERLAPIVEACAEVDAVALVGVPVEGENGGAHIAMLAVDADGASVAYRKMWLGEEESERFTPGDSPAAYEVDGWRLGLAICKDTGVERHAAETAALGIDAYVAGTVKAADEAALQEERLRAVARDHGVWAALASFAGPTGGGYDQTAGGSGVWSPQGEAVARAGPEIGAVARATLT